MEDIVDTGIYISSEDYWKWRLTIEEQGHAGTRVKLCQRDVKIKELERSIEVFKFQSANREHDKAKDEYIKIKKEIEGKIGLPLNDVIIDEHTFEVRQIKNMEKGE